HFRRRWTICQSSGWPATGFRTLPGRRVDPMRAWITATTRLCSRASTSGTGPPPPYARRAYKGGGGVGERAACEGWTAGAGERKLKPEGVKNKHHAASPL